MRRANARRATKRRHDPLADYVRRRLPRSRSLVGTSRVPLQAVMFGQEELLESIQTLLSGRVVMGARVRRFETRWCEWLGCRHAVATTSGTTALLLAMMWLKFHRATPDRNEVLMPAVTWSTTMTAALVVGLRPVLVDVQPDTLCVDSFAPYLTERTLAVVPVHLLGHACDMTRIMAEAGAAGVQVIEDACEAHGAQWQGRRVGTFGDVGCFSFMFAHHISTIEGGMLTTKDEALADTLRGFRAHGWVRELSPGRQAAHRRAHPEIDPRFLFVDVGLNVRPTEIVGAFGWHQLAKIDGFIARRRQAFVAIAQALAPYGEWLRLFPERAGEFYSPFAFPIIVNEGAPFTREALVRHLERRGIETRPIVAGNLARQPVFERYRHLIDVRGPLTQAELVHRHGFFFGINQGTDAAKVAYIVDTLTDFLHRAARRRARHLHAV